MYDRAHADILGYHNSMLADRVRTESYLKAILKIVKPGDVVLDIGCGSGILTVFACLAGARHVYALEQGPIIQIAKDLCHRNGFGDRVTFVQDWSTNVTLPEAADVLITETIGNIDLDEGIIGWVIDARKRLLVEQGRLLPANVTLMAVPIESKDDYQEVDGFMGPLYSLDFSGARDLAANNIYWTEL